VCLLLYWFSHRIIGRMDLGRQMDVNYIDLRKAFDTIDHSQVSNF